MAVPDTCFKPNGHTHRDLIEEAERFLAAQIRQMNPRLGEARALARATRQLAGELGVHRSWLVRMRQSGHVPEKHWRQIEQATGGKVTAADFERAARNE